MHVFWYTDYEGCLESTSITFNRNSSNQKFNLGHPNSSARWWIETRKSKRRLASIIKRTISSQQLNLWSWWQNARRKDARSWRKAYFRKHLNQVKLKSQKLKGQKTIKKWSRNNLLFSRNSKSSKGLKSLLHKQKLQNIEKGFRKRVIKVEGIVIKAVPLNENLSTAKPPKKSKNSAKICQFSRK